MNVYCVSLFAIHFRSNTTLDCTVDTIVTPSDNIFATVVGSIFNVIQRCSFTKLRKNRSNCAKYDDTDSCRGLRNSAISDPLRLHLSAKSIASETNFEPSSEIACSSIAHSPGKLSIRIIPVAVGRTGRQLHEVRAFVLLDLSKIPNFRAKGTSLKFLNCATCEIRESDF